MARRNVDLVISAKDEAAKVLDQITAALKEFSDASRGVGSSAERAESSLGELGAAVSALKKNFDTLKVADRLDADLNAAAASLARFEGELEESQAEARQLERELDRAAEASQRFDAKLEGATNALARQKASLKEAVTDQRELSKAYTQAEAAQTKLIKRQAELPAAIAAQSQKVEEARVRYADLEAQIRGTEGPSASLTKRFEQAERSLTSKAAKLKTLRAEYSGIGGQINAAGSAMTLFGSQAQKATVSVERQEKVFGQIAANVDKLEAASRSAGQQQNRLAANASKANAALARQSQQVEKAQADFVDFAAGLGQADAALARLGARSLGQLEQTLKNQRRAALETKREYIELGQRSKTLAEQMRGVAEPSERLQQEFAEITAKAALAKAEYLEQRAALELMGRAFRETGQDMESINATQARFQALMDRSAAELNQFSANTQRAQQRVDALGTSANRAAGGVQRLTGATERAGRASSRAATETGRLAGAYRQFYGDTRRSLSLLQRIRGEVLSLVAAYGGLFAVIETLRGTVDAYQQLEAAQSRLNVATGGDQQRTAEELDFLRRTADRLGIQFGALATEYSKFSIATQNTNLEGAATREIFVSVAEAARVNRSSVREMSGVFVALTQIVSKGAVQMEELRQQLGDRLPGALKLMADGLGVGTEELTKMLEQGQVSSDALLPFARELQERFGPGLEEALASTSTAIGRLANEAFEALLRFGQAGFLDSFTNLVNVITQTLQSAEFQDFSARLSVAISKIVDVVAFAIENFNILFAVLTGFLALKITPLFIALGSTLTDVARTAKGTTASFTALQTRAAAMGVTISRVGLIVRNLRKALLLLLGTTGVGLLVAAIGSGIALWATSATDATEALIEHERIVDAVKNAYDAAGRSVDDTLGLITDINTQDASKNLRDLKAAQEEALDAFNFAVSNRGGNFLTNFFGKNLAPAAREYSDAVEEVVRKVNNGQIPISQLSSELDKVNAKFRDGSAVNNRYGDALNAAAKVVVDNAAAVREAELVYQVLNGTIDEKKAALEELSGALKESAADQDKAAQKAEAFRGAMEGLAGILPGVKAQLDFIEQSKAIEKLAADGLAAATSLSQVNGILAETAAAYDRIDTNFIGSGGSLASRIIGVESAGDPLAKNPLSTATGLGQFIETTWLELFQRYFPQEASGLSREAILELRKDADFSRNMVELYLAENARNLRRAGQEVNDANLYLSHFLGPGGANAVLSAAPGTLANDILDPAQINSNQSILDGRTREEVIAWAQQKVGISQNELQVLERQKAALKAQREEEQRQNDLRDKELAKQREATNERLEDGAFELEQQRLITAGKERQAAIEKAVRDAKKENPAIEAAQLKAIRDQAAALFDVEQARKNANNESKEAKKAEEEVNRLISIRSSLLEQIKLAQASGDTEQIDNLRLRVGEVNAEIGAAIENAKRLWEAVGGTEADAAIEKLNTAKLETEGFGKNAENTYLQWERVGDLIVQGLSGAFDQFAQAVANGENATQALRDAFLQFAADFLREIALMIIRQAIFNALQAAFGGSPFGALIGVGTAHTGGLIGSKRAGSGNSTRQISPAAFANAARFHQGGIVGLKPGEVPIIAKQGEEMLTRDDPRHMLNGGGSGGTAAQKKAMTIINTFDPAEAVERALSTPRGEEVLVNAVRTNRTDVKAALE